MAKAISVHSKPKKYYDFGHSGHTCRADPGNCSTIKYAKDDVKHDIIVFQFRSVTQNFILCLCQQRHKTS